MLFKPTSGLPFSTTSRFLSTLRTSSRNSPTLFSPSYTTSLHKALKRTMSSSSAAARRLEGKTILITGASSGIGRSTALEFARTAPNHKLKLILTARRSDALHQVAADIKKEVGPGVSVLPVKLDVSNLEEIKQFVPGLPEEWRDIHVLVNNA
jgi:3-hydroxy acid dehydrogenase/malonic semialdehyde reductase